VKKIDSSQSVMSKRGRENSITPTISPQFALLATFSTADPLTKLRRGISSLADRVFRGGGVFWEGGGGKGREGKGREGKERKTDRFVRW